LTEKELIQGCTVKDARCQRILFDRYAGRMLSVCRRYASDQREAEDMLQEAFIRVFSYIHQFEFQGSFEGWIRRITVNASLRFLSQRKIQFSPLEDESSFSVSADDLTALDNLGAEELFQLIASLPSGYRIVFNLYAVEGYSHEEIAALLGIQPVTSRTQLRKARKMLQEKILGSAKTIH
jgi:RNA polymerase sigma factor (sigma-70 family)